MTEQKSLWNSLIKLLKTERENIRESKKTTERLKHPLRGFKLSPKKFWTYCKSILELYLIYFLALYVVNSLLLNGLMSLHFARAGFVELINVICVIIQLLYRIVILVLTIKCVLRMWKPVNALYYGANTSRGVKFGTRLLTLLFCFPLVGQAVGIIYSFYKIHKLPPELTPSSAKSKNTKKEK